MADEPFSPDDLVQKQLGPFDWAKTKAGKLFCEIREVLGDEGARQVFRDLGTPPAASKLKRARNQGILLRLKRMPGGPNVKQLAREIAQEKYSKPTLQQIETEERQIQRLNARKHKHIPRRKDAPPLLRNVPRLSYNPARKLWRDDATGETYDEQGFPRKG
jgi:hypothetical protein